MPISCGGGARRAGLILNKDRNFQRPPGSAAPISFGNPDRARRNHRAAQQCAASTRLRLGDFRRGKPHCGTALSASRFPDPVSTLVDAERRAQFEEAGAHFESAYYLTFLWLPPSEEASRAERWLYEGRARETAVNAHELLNGFIDRIDRVLQLVEGFVRSPRGSPIPRH